LRYGKTLVKLASEIKEAREMINRDRTKIIVDPSSINMPRTKREALETVLEARGIEAEIMGEKETSTATLFTIMVKRDRGSTTHKVFIPSSTMEKEEVYDEIVEILKITSVIESEHVMHVEGRPPPDQIGIHPQRLKSRMTSFDGFNPDGTTVFTYTPIGNTFTGPRGLVGEELLRHIDAKIIQMHFDYERPFECEVLETQSFENPTVINAKNPLGDIANTIDRLARSKVDSSLIPPEYRAAVFRIRDDRSFADVESAKPMKAEEIREFQDAFSELDHPAHRMVQMLHPHYVGADGELSDEGKIVLRETLDLNSGHEIAVDGGALHNIAIAYERLSGEKTESWGEEDLRRNHFKMMFVIRRSLNQMTGSNDFSADF